MEPPQFTATSHSKLRLMCSYGGQIIPRPDLKSLCYSGGDTRIVAVDRRIITSISSFTGHISAKLLIHQPFTIKYQLPHHDLDSLISIATDDDLLIMFDEYDRIAASPTPSRIRLFLFVLKQHQPRPQLPNSPTDSWFSDALESAKIMRRKDGLLDSGLVVVDTETVEAQNESSIHESLVLDTSSSLGSASSSNSSAIGFHVEECRSNLQDIKVKLPKQDSILSAISETKTGITHECVVEVASLYSGIASPHVELQSNISTAASAQVNTPLQVSGYPITSQLAHHPQQQQQQQQMQLVQASSPYVIPQYPTGQLPVSNSPMYPPKLHYQTHYRPSQASPVYVLPVSQTQPYNLPVQCNMIDNGITVAPSRPLMHSNVAMIPPQMTFTEATTVTPAPKLATKVYRASPAAIPVHVTSTQNQQQLTGLQPVHHARQSVAISTMEANSNCTIVGDDPAYNLIYKTQPPGPAPLLPSQIHTGATALLLSEDLTKLHKNDAAQHLRT